MTTFKIRAELNNYHAQIIKTEVAYQIRKMCQKSGSQCSVDVPSILFSVDLLSSTLINPNISSYDPQVLLSTIIFDRAAPCIFLCTSLKDQSTLFPSSLPSLSPAVPVKDSSIIPFNTSSGTLQIPDTICHHLLTNQTLCKFELPLFCKNIHFSYQPFLTFHPVESKLGKVFLPTSPGIYRPTQVAMLPISVPPVRSRNLRHTDAPRQNTHDMRTYRSHHQYSSAIDTITQALQNLDVPRPSIGNLPALPSQGAFPTPPTATSNHDNTPPVLPPLAPIPSPNQVPLHLQNHNEPQDIIHSLQSALQPDTSSPARAPSSPTPQDGAFGGSSIIDTSDTVVQISNTSTDQSHILNILASEIEKPNTMDFSTYKSGNFYSLPPYLRTLNNNILKELQSFRQQDILATFQPFYSENNSDIVCDKKHLTLPILQSLDNFHHYCQKNQIDLINTKFTNPLSKLKTVLTRADKKNLDVTN